MRQRKRELLRREESGESDDQQEERLIVRTVKGQPIGPLSGSTTLSDHDVERFMSGDRGGARPTVRRASTMAAGALGAAMAKKEVVLSPRAHDRAVLAALDHVSPRGETISAFVHGNS